MSTNPTRNIFNRKGKSPFERESIETTKSQERSRELEEIKSGNVGSLVNFFAQKIQEKEKE